jgi:hypothetical protein
LGGETVLVVVHSWLVPHVVQIDTAERIEVEPSAKHLIIKSKLPPL